MLDTTLMTVLKCLALAQAAPAGTGEGAAAPSNPFGGIMMVMIAMFAIMYFLTIRPNQKREKERREMLAALAKGDRVITTGGIFGTIIGLNDKSVVLRVCDEPAVKLEFVRAAVTRVERDAEKGRSSAADKDSSVND